MRERLGGRHVRQRSPVATAEGTTGCRQHEPPDLFGRARAQRLRDRGVLGVDGHDLTGLGARRHEIAADDERLLVGERERAPALERGEGRAEPDGSGDAVEHDVGLDVADELLGLVRTERGVLDVELLGLRGDELPVGSGGEAYDLEAAGVGPDDVERLRADGAGGTEDEDATHVVSLRAAQRPRLRSSGRATAERRRACCDREDVDDEDERLAGEVGWR